MAIKKLKKHLSEDVSAQALADLPVHPSAAAAQIPDKFANNIKEEDNEEEPQMKEDASAQAKADLPVHPSDASEELPDSLAGKLGARKIKPEQNGLDIANKAGQHGNKQGVQLPEEEEDDEEEKDKLDELCSAKMKKEEDDKEEDDDELSEEEKKDLEEEDEDEKKKDDEEVKEDVNALLRDENLPEEFQKKAATIFEAAIKRTVARKLGKKTKKLVEIYKNKSVKKSQNISEALVNKIDTYLDYVVEEWLKDNEVAIESGLKSEITERFILGLRNLFEESYIEIPENKKDILINQENKISGLEKELNEQYQKNVELHNRLASLERAGAIKNLSSDLTDTDAEKFKDLVSGVSFENIDAFSQKLNVIKETYFPKAVKASSDLDSSLLTEGGIKNEEPTKASDPVMEAYVEAISRAVKR